MTELSTVEHDSLKIWPERGAWHWYSRGVGGDVLDWYQMQHKCEFRVALEELARQAGVDLAPLTPARQREMNEQRQREAVFALAASWFHQVLLASTAAMAYCGQRGWTNETVAQFGLGYTGMKAQLPERSLSASLREVGLSESPAAKAVLSIPFGMLIYPHEHHGRTVYLSARSLEGKRHYNLPVELAGPKRPFPAPAIHPARSGVRVLVEGQADAISLAQLGFDALAVCGITGASDDAVSHVALDNDAKGLERALGLAS